MTQPLIKKILQSSLETKQKALESADLVSAIDRAAGMLVQCAKSNRMIMSCGNGGSTCDAMHLNEELVARYKSERRGIRSMHLMDSSIMTCWSNDYSFDDVFARQVETFGESGDLLVAFSTSGNSRNVLKAVETAKKQKVATVALTGKGGGKVAGMVDVAIVAPSNDTERIQEIHLTVVHIFCEVIEAALFGK